MAGRRMVRASAEMREGFAIDRMEPAAVVRTWFEALFRRHPFADEAIDFFWTLRLEAGDLSREWGGGFWWGDQRLVQVRGAQDEAALHELAHAFWHDARERDNNARRLMAAVVRLAEEPDPRYDRARRLAHDYVHGIPSQPDPDSPTGFWRGMLVEQNDWEMFAGLASGTMGEMRLLPPYVRDFFAGLFACVEEAADDEIAPGGRPEEAGPKDKLAVGELAEDKRAGREGAEGGRMDVGGTGALGAGAGG